MPKRKRFKPLDAILLALVAAGIALAALIAGSYLAQDAAYRDLSAQASSPEDPGAGIDWEALLAQNPECVAWLSVEGTRIDYPVVQPGAGKAPDWYLRHDFWGSPSSIGCLYLDRRAEADGRHMLVFGHHLGFSGQMFSDVYDAYGQDAFDGIGTAKWSTPGKGTVEFEPAFAMSVDMSYAPVQTFEFDTVADLQDWARGLSGDATASSADCESLIDGASRALTLCTCSSEWGGQRARTLVVFLA